MAITRIAKASAAGNTNVATTPSRDTTGATLLVVGVTQYLDGVVVTDSYSNTWLPLTQKVGSAPTQLWYCKNPTVGSGHTFTGTLSGSYLVIAMSAYSGANLYGPFDVENGVASGSQPGAVVPLYDNSLVITVAGNQSPLTSTIDSSFTVQEQISYSGGNNYGIALADKIQTAAGSENPTWSSTDGPLVIAVFTEANPPGPVVVAHAGGQSADAVNATTTPAINTTGAELIVIHIAIGTALGAPTVTDNKSNTWTALTAKTAGSQTSQLYYCVNPTVGAGHTFSVAAYIDAIQVLAVRGIDTASAFDVENGNTGGTGTIQTGSVSPARDRSLIVSGIEGNFTVNPYSINQGFRKTDFSIGNPAPCLASGFAFLIQNAKAAVNPTWTPTTSTNDNQCTTIAVFKSNSVDPALTANLSDALDMADAAPKPDLRFLFGLGDIITLIDSISFISGGAISSQLSEFFTFNDAVSTGIGYLVKANDALSMLDHLSGFLTLNLPLGDSIANWGEHVDSDHSGVTLDVTIHDAFPGWADAIRFIKDARSVQLSDALVLVDMLNIRLFYLSSLGDAFLQNDALRINLSDESPGLGDNFSQQDSVSFQLFAIVNRNAGDAMTMADAVTVEVAQSQEDYIRRYLNDKGLPE